MSPVIWIAFTTLLLIENNGKAYTRSFWYKILVPSFKSYLHKPFYIFVLLAHFMLFYRFLFLFL